MPMSKYRRAPDIIHAGLRRASRGVDAEADRSCAAQEQAMP
jgi:hypothetical protein